MAILSNLGAFPIDLEAEGVDTVILDIGARIAISALSVHNTTVALREVWFYISIDTTSANGIRVARVVLESDDSTDVGELIGQGIIEANTVIAVQKTTGAVAGDLNVLRTQTTYTEGS